MNAFLEYGKFVRRTELLHFETVAKVNNLSLKKREDLEERGKGIISPVFNAIDRT
ncbi:hypothetical protein HMPREF1869_01785 [Bacteroidales bacterium KA00251]|nr:hypothetical protein HMPREF1869_01785 [Bacteroidales bacterium KA00251]